MNFVLVLYNSTKYIANMIICNIFHFGNFGSIVEHWSIMIWSIPKKRCHRPKSWGYGRKGQDNHFATFWACEIQEIRNRLPRSQAWQAADNLQNLKEDRNIFRLMQRLVEGDMLYAKTRILNLNWRQMRESSGNEIYKMYTDIVNTEILQSDIAIPKGRAW